MAPHSTREDFYRELDKQRHRRGFSCMIFAGVVGLIILGLLAYFFLRDSISWPF